MTDRKRDNRRARLATACGMVVTCGMTIVGCRSYAPMPLSDVEQGLATPTDGRLRVRASELKHPLIPPVELRLDDGLTPDDAAVVAVLVNPGLRAVRAQRGSASAAVLQAGLLPNPVLAYGSDFLLGHNPPGSFNTYGGNLSWDATSLISRGAKMRSAADAAESVDLSVAWQEWQTAEAAKTAVYDLVSLQSQQQLLGQISGRLTDQSETMRVAGERGLRASVDVRAAEAAARDGVAAVLQAARDVEHQRLVLNRALGFPPDVRVKIRTGMRLASSFDPPDAASLCAGLDRRRIDLVALRKGYDSAEQTLRAAVLDQFPKINLGLTGGRDNGNVRSLGFVATIDLPIFDRNQAVIDAQTATRQRLYDEFTGRVFDARADIAAAVTDLRAISAQITDAEAAVPNLQKLVDDYKAAVDHGNADVISYYVAWNNLAQKELGVLKLQQQLADTRVALELAAGRYFPDPPTTRPSRTEPSQAGPPETRPVETRP